MAVAKIVAAIDHGHRELSLSSTAGTQLERSRIDHERTHEAGRFTVLALSPHLDDAVMSVGASLAALAEAGSQVMLCTVFAGAPAPPLSEAARVFHAHCGLADDGVAVRRAEDEAASAAIGTQSLHLKFLDAIYRSVDGTWLYRRPDAALDPDWPAEPELTAEVTLRLHEVTARVSPDVVWTCAAIGGHIDHRIVRDSASMMCASRALDLLLWEDLPYALHAPAAAGVAASSVTVNERHLQRKLAAISNYRSQLRAMWPCRTNWRALLLDHARDRYASLGTAEPMWRAIAGGTDAPRILKGGRHR